MAWEKWGWWQGPRATEEGGARDEKVVEKGNRGADYDTADVLFLAPVQRLGAD